MLRHASKYLSALAMVSLSIFAANCSIIAKSDLKGGVGSRCTAATDCQGGFCEKGVCASQCVSDTECPSPALCVSGKCKVACKTQVDDNKCGAGRICEANECRAGCRDDGQCAAGTEICDKTALVCRAGCRDDKGCAAGQVCDLTNLTCVKGCTGDTGEKGCPNGEICEKGGCIAGCREDVTKGKTCPAGQYCEGLACKPAIQVGAVLPGATDGTDGWSTSHRFGLDDTAKARPYVRFKDKPYQIKESIRTAPAIRKEIDTFVSEGANVIVTASKVGTEEAYAAAAKYPAVKFIAANAKTHNSLTNLGAYGTNNDAGWYVAGRVAGRVVAATKNKCIGLILPNASRQVVRETNAFILGAKKQGDIKVVIRWMGSSIDPDPPSYDFKSNTVGFFDNVVKLTREQLLATQLADVGCAVVAHRTETQRIVGFIEKTIKDRAKTFFGHDLYSMGSDLQYACRLEYNNPDSTWQKSCLGSLYWNWGRPYGRVFDMIKAGTWKGETFIEPFKATADSILKYELSEFSSLHGVTKADLADYVQKIANNPEDVFRPGHYGGFNFVGQRDLDKDGTPDSKQKVFDFEDPLPEAELERMCWFVEGALEFPACSSAGCKSSFDLLVPAQVPYGPKMSGPTCDARADKCTSTLKEANVADKAKYGDVIDFIRKQSGDPETLMDCRVN